MNRIIEIVAMVVGGLSLFLVCFVAFAAMSGRDMSQVAVLGKLFPAPVAHDEAQHEDGGERQPSHKNELSDTAVIESSLGLLSAWTLPSPYSTSELRGMSEELKHKLDELDQREQALDRRERDLQTSEQEVEERLRTLEELRKRLESLQAEIAQREQDVSGKEDAARMGREAHWTDLAAVIGGIDDTSVAAKRLQEFEPAEAGEILRALNDDERASEILNAIDGALWKEYVAAYTASAPVTPSRRK